MDYSWKFTLCTISFAFLTLTANISNADIYIGVDAHMRHLHFKQNFGGNILKDMYPTANVFGGFMFNQYFGVEVGYEFSKKQHTISRDNPRKIVLGRPIRSYSPRHIGIVYDISRAFAKMNGYNLNLVGLLPILYLEDNVQLLGSVGASHLQLKARNSFQHTRITACDFLEKPITDVFVDTVSYKKSKTVLRLTGGIQFKLKDCISMRALITFENTAKLAAQAKNSVTNKSVVGLARPKNSVKYGVGIFMNFL